MAKVQECSRVNMIIENNQRAMHGIGLVCAPHPPHCCGKWSALVIHWNGQFN